jgi:hypothetical protein
VALSKIKANSITDNSITVDQIADTAVHGRRNLVINGAMQIAQRGTSNTGKTTSHFVTDRFEYEITNAGTWTTSQSSTSPAQFSNSLKADCTTADSSLASGDLLRIVYQFEGQDMQRLLYGESTAKALILSFWVRSNKTGTYNIQFQQADNSYKQVTKSFTIDTADTWEQKEVTIPGDTAGAINDDNGEGFRICWVLAAGSTFTGGSERSTWTTFANADVAPTQTVNLADSTSNEFYLTGVQLEVGDKATPFEHRSFGEELSLCQRYYSKSYNYDVAPGTATGAGQEVQRGVTQGGGYTGSVFDFPVAMRTAPTMTFFLSGSTNDAGQWNINHSGGTSAVTATAHDTGTSGTRADITGGISAWTACQVYGHWVADAEL